MAAILQKVKALSRFEYFPNPSYILVWSHEIINDLGNQTGLRSQPSPESGCSLGQAGYNLCSKYIQHNQLEWKKEKLGQIDRGRISAELFGNETGHLHFPHCICLLHLLGSGRKVAGGGQLLYTLTDGFRHFDLAISFGSSEFFCIWLWINHIKSIFWYKELVNGIFFLIRHFYCMFMFLFSWTTCTDIVPRELPIVCFSINAGWRWGRMCWQLNRNRPTVYGHGVCLLFAEVETPVCTLFHPIFIKSSKTVWATLSFRWLEGFSREEDSLGGDKHWAESKVVFSPPESLKVWAPWCCPTSSRRKWEYTHSYVI